MTGGEPHEAHREASWRPPGWVLLLYLLVAGAGLLFARLARNILGTDGVAFDATLLRWFDAIATPGLTRFARGLDRLAIWYVLGAVVVGVGVVLWRRRRRASALFLGLAFWGAVGLNLVLKAGFVRPRPDLFEQLTPISNVSFPSGHAMGSWAFALGLVLVLARLAPRRAWLFGPMLVVFAVAVGVSRVYLQVHYPTDVVAGWLASTAWVLAVASWYLRTPRPPDAPDATPAGVPGRGS